MKLEDIGFYTLSDFRAKHSTELSDLQRCELILTNKCNFKCIYCRGLKNEYCNDISFDWAKYIIKEWQKKNLLNIRFSGGEPTLYKDLIDLVLLSKKTCKHIAISTNGSADLKLYKELIKCGVNDFSISLDSCCSSLAEKISGVHLNYEQIINNIKELSKITYTTIGIVLTPDNINEIKDLIYMGYHLGVSDIRIIPSAQWMSYFNKRINIKKEILKKYPILKYRINNIFRRNIRGISFYDSNTCPLVLDDMAVVGKHHYPCIIYLREKGNPIGEFSNIEQVMQERYEWFAKHDCHRDNICKNNCLDVCVDYNNKWWKFRREF